MPVIELTVFEGHRRIGRVWSESVSPYETIAARIKIGDRVETLPEVVYATGERWYGTKDLTMCYVIDPPSTGVEDG